MYPDQAKKDYTLVVILSFTTILGVVIALFFYFQNQQLRKQLLVTPPSPVASIASTPSPSPISVSLPIVSNPLANSVITSPFKVTGTVPAGWMFEGNFPIKLIDSKKKVLVQTVAEEDIAGSWQEDTPASFSATLTFKNATGSGTLILSKDNPSGLPQNAATFEVPVQF
jgi:hypothetical protein